MEFLTGILCIIFICTVLKALHSISRSKSILTKLPPGPKPLPIIGNLHLLGVKPHKSFAELAKIHGPLMSLKLGRVTTIVVSSSTMAKEFLQTHDHLFSNRTIPDALHVHGHENIGLPWIPVSLLWRNLRKICNTQLFATKILDTNQDIRRKQVQALLANIHKSSLNGEAVDFGEAAFKTTLNLLSNTIFSTDLADPDSETGRELREIVYNIMREAGKPNLGDYFPFLRKIDLQGIRKRMEVYFGKLLDLFHGIIKQRLRLRESATHVRNNDVLDILLDLTEDKSGGINVNQIEHQLMVLFIAGNDTTAATVQWAMAEVLRNPMVLLKAKAELEQTIGKGNPVEESDIPRLPYLQAIVKETFRLHPVVPLLLPRKAEADAEIGSFIIPKNAQIFVNVWAIGRDPSNWDDPNSFIPERFLGSDIDVRGRNFELTPFGGGRRVCPGLPLAMRFLPLMLGSLIHSFDWKLVDGNGPEDINIEDKFGLSLEMAQPLRALPICLGCVVVCSTFCSGSRKCTLK